MRRLLVLNRMHLDEWPADQVAVILNGLRMHPAITGITRDAPSAGGERRRGYDANITDCFPGRPDGNRKQRDAWTITQLAQHADLVLDIHGTANPGWDYPFYGAAGRADPLIKGAASLLGGERAAILGAPHPAGVLPHYVGWDLSPGTTLLGKLHRWLTRLAGGWIPPARPMAEYQIVGGIREDDALRLRLARQYPPFARLPDKASARSASRYRHTPSRGARTCTAIPATGAR